MTCAHVVPSDNEAHVPDVHREGHGARGGCGGRASAGPAHAHAQREAQALVMPTPIHSVPPGLYPLPTHCEHATRAYRWP